MTQLPALMPPFRARLYWGERDPSSMTPCIEPGDVWGRWVVLPEFRDGGPDWATELRVWQTTGGWGEPLTSDGVALA